MLEIADFSKWHAGPSPRTTRCFLRPGNECGCLGLQFLGERIPRNVSARSRKRRLRLRQELDPQRPGQQVDFQLMNVLFRGAEELTVQVNVESGLAFEPHRSTTALTQFWMGSRGTRQSQPRKQTQHREPGQLGGVDVI